MARVLGLGFRAGAREASLADAMMQIGGGATHLATPRDKATAPALLSLAARLALPVVAVPADDLAREETATLSEASLRRFGVGSVAEASALAGARALGVRPRLLRSRVVSADSMATAALAECDAPPAPATEGAS